MNYHLLKDEVSLYCKEELRLINKKNFYILSKQIDDSLSYIAGMKRIIRLCKNGKEIKENIEALEQVEKALEAVSVQK